MKSKERTCFRHAASAIVLLALAFVTASAAQAQTYTDLLNFSGAPNPSFITSAVQGRDGNFYGGSFQGGANNLGTIFKVTPAGVATVIYSLTTADGNPQCNPSVSLLGTDGNFYGACSFNSNGYIFKVTPAGVFTHLHDFAGTDGADPFLTFQGNDGNFYGACQNGGANSVGTVFKITPTGTLTTIFSFQGNATSAPEHPAGLVQGKDGNFYGAALRFEANGNVFKLTPAGVLTEVFDFFDSANQGNSPSGFALGKDGNFYGVTSMGGANNQGTIYKVTPTGTFTLLHSFNVNTDGGEFPSANLTQASDGNFYSTAVNCNAFGCTLPENIYKVTPAGAYTSLASFNMTNGEFPFSGVTQDTSGIFYGVTDQGGTFGDGVFYSLNNSLNAFAGLVSTAGKVGSMVGILGQGFTNSSVVKFGGVAATTISVSGGTFINATVPAGALGGFVTVTTGATTLTSLKKFRVTPAITSFSPTSGPEATSVMITGSGLTTTTKVTFGGVTATTFTVNSDSKVTATVPASAITGKIGITTSGGSTTSKGSFKVTPAIASFTPSGGVEGTVVTIRGTGFAQATAVSFGGVAATVFTVNSDTQVTATVPAGAKTGAIGVTSPGGTGTSSSNFHVTPTISNFTPPSGPEGTAVTITGTGLMQTTAVTFGGVAATVFAANSDTQVTATVPSGALTGAIKITTPGGTVSFGHYKVTPTITRFTPTSGPVGTKVRIIGTGLKQTTGVTFGGVAATVFTVNSDVQVTATVPTGAVTGKIAVTTAGGTATSTATFTVN